MQGKYLGEIAHNDRLLKKINSPYTSVNFGIYGNYGNVGNYGNPESHGSITPSSDLEDVTLELY